jgi:RimJ/RimL family protein N-acetyltransferase
MDSIVVNGLCIRPFDEGDVPAFAGAVRESVATVGVWMPWCHAAYSEADARSWFDHCRANLSAARAYDLGIFLQDGRALCGGISINQLNVQHNFGNIGYWVRQSRQRQGVATRAVRIIAAYGFDRLQLTRLEIVAAVDNRASRGVAEKVGATFECVARNRLVVKGQPVAAAVYSLTPEWSGARANRRETAAFRPEARTDERS